MSSSSRESEGLQSQEGLFGEERTGEAQAFQTARVALIAAGHAVHDTYTAFLPPLLPLFIVNLGLSKTEAGLLTVFILTPSLLQPFIGHLADRHGLRSLVILAPALSAMMMSMLTVAPGYAMLALLLTLAGLSSAGLHAVGPAIAGRLSGQGLGRGMGFWMVGGELGRTIGPLVIVTAVKLLTPGRVPWLALAGVVASVVLYLRLRDVQTIRVGRGSAVPWHSALERMKPVLFPLVGVITARLFLVVSLTVYLPTLLTEEGSRLWFAGASLSILEAAGVVGALLGGSLSDRLGRRRTLLVSQSVTPFLMTLFLAAEGWMRLPLLLALGLTSLSIGPVIMALVQESFPANRALANGVYMFLNFTIRSIVVVALGAIGDGFGLRQAFGVSAVIMFFGLLFVLRLPERTSRRFRW